MLTHRQIARSKARRWQLGAVALVGVAGAAAILPVQRLLTPSELSDAPIQATTGPASGGVSAHVPQLDTGELSRVLASVGQAAPPPPPPPPPPAPETTTVAAGTEPAPVVAHGSTPQFVGSIITPRTRHAILKVGETRKMVRQGETFEGSTLVLVEPDQITLERDGTETTVPIIARTKAWPDEPPKRPVSFRAPPSFAGAPGAAGQPFMPGQPGAPGTKGGAMPHSASASSVPGTFDQAREQARARALAEAARRAAVPPPQPQPQVQPPQSTKPGSMSAEQATTHLNGPEANVDETTSGALESLGVVPGMSSQDAMNVLRDAGVNATDRTLRLLENNASRKPEGLSPDMLQTYQSMNSIEKAVYGRLTPELRTDFLKRKASGDPSANNAYLEKMNQK